GSSRLHAKLPDVLSLAHRNEAASWSSFDPINISRACFCMQGKDVLVSPVEESTMMKSLSVACVTTAVLLSALAVSRPAARGGQPAAQNAATTGPAFPPADPGSKVPAGFTPIFNGKDLTGWHVSKTNHHGTTPDYHVQQGLIVGTQNPRGKGGILLTDKKYK